MPRFRLSDMELDFVSLVLSGDDPAAQVVLAKASPEGSALYVKGPVKTCAGCQDDKKKCAKHQVNKSTEKGSSSSTLPVSNLQEENPMPDIKKDDLDPEVLAYVEGLETEVTTLAAQVEKAEKDLTDKDERIAKMAPLDPEAAEKEMLSKADPALRAYIEKNNAAVASANAIAKAERDTRLDREFIAKAESLPMITEDKATLAGVLRRASEALTVEDNTVLDTVLKAANAQIAQGNLFASVGLAGGITTVSKSVESAAAEIKKANPTWTMDQCQAEVYTTNPDLLAQAMTGQEG